MIAQNAIQMNQSICHKELRTHTQSHRISGRQTFDRCFKPIEYFMDLEFVNSFGKMDEIHLKENILGMDEIFTMCTCTIGMNHALTFFG